MFCSENSTTSLFSSLSASRIFRFSRYGFRLAFAIGGCFIASHTGALQFDTAQDHADEPERFAVADFHQERHIETLSRPLVSSGTVELTDVGFAWKQNAPYVVWLIYDGTRAVEQTRIGGHETTTEILDPVVNKLTSTLFQMLGGTLASMELGFEIHRLVANDDSDWRYELIPRDAAIRGTIPRIEIGGGHFLNRIRVDESRGNFTLIELTGQRPLE
jgi:hypothetical protein